MQVLGERARLDRRVRRPAERSPGEAPSAQAQSSRVKFTRKTTPRISKIIEKGLDFQRQKAVMYCNFSQLRLGDPKGLPSFFAHSDCHWATPHQFSIAFVSS
jgi:hypothetical protein